MLLAFLAFLPHAAADAPAAHLKTGENPFPEGRFRPSGKRFPTTCPLRGRPCLVSPPAGIGGRLFAARQTQRLLQVDLGAGCFELGLELLAIGLGNGFLDRLGSRLDQVLGFLEAKAGNGADFLDDVDLIVAE